MTSRHFVFLALCGALTAEAAPPSFSAVDHPIGFSLSPLSPSVTDLPLWTPENTLVDELDDLSGRVPNLFVSSTARHSFGDLYSIRGLTSGRLFSDPVVGLYVDGVPFGSSFTYGQPLYGIDHINFYRGPQATLFGLGSEGGLIDVETRPADSKEWHGEASGLYGDFRTVEHRGWLGGPLIKDRLTLELGGFAGTSQGYVDNTFLGGRRDERDTLAGRAVLTWTPLGDWKISVGYDGSRARDGSSRFTSMGGDPFQVRSDEEGSFKQENHREWLSIGRKFETWEVRSTTAHQSWQVDPAVQDLDLSPDSVRPRLVNDPLGFAFFDTVPTDGAVSRLRLQQEVWSQELRFQSRPGTSAFWWNAGVFFQHRRTTGENDLEQVYPSLETQLVPLPPTIFSFPGDPALGFPGFTFIDPNVELRDVLRVVPFTDRNAFAQHEESWSTFLNGGRRWGALSVAAGVRLNYVRKTLDRTLSLTDFAYPGFDDAAYVRAYDAASAASLRLAPGSAPGESITLPSGIATSTRRQRYSAEDDDVNFSPSLGFTYNVQKQVQLFVRTSYVVKPGGFNPLVLDDGRYSQYGREQIWATEGGIRASAFHGRLQAQLTGYANRIEDYQLDVGTPDYFIGNAGRARSLGVEFEFAWQLRPNLVLSGSYGRNQTELTEILPGNQVPYVPIYTASVALDYRPFPGISGHLEYRAVGDTEYSVTGEDAVHQDAFGEVNLRLGYETNHLGVFLFGRNLSDTKRYTQKQFTSYAGSIGEPRILGAMATVKF